MRWMLPALAGVLALGEHTIVFALLRNGPGPSWKARREQDRIVRLLAEHAKSPRGGTP